MTLSARINKQEFEASQRIVWQPHYRLNRFNNYVFHRLGIIWVMLCVLVVTVVEELFADRFRVWGRCVGFAFGAMIAIVLFRHMMSSNPKLLAQVNASLPDFIDVEESAVTLRTIDGRACVLPWTLALGWRAADEVIVLEFPQSEVYVLPLSPLSSEDRLALYELVRTRLGEPRIRL